MTTLTLASWNVNSLRVRLPQVLDWLEHSAIDAAVLQETKLTDDAFSSAAFNDMGYDVIFTGQKTYNGVALLSKQSTFLAPTDCDYALPHFPDSQKRLIAATLTPRAGGEPIRFVGGYIPNGQMPGSAKYLYKLDWLSTLQGYLKESLQRWPRLVVGGDFNIAPTDADCWNPLLWEGKILVSQPERAAFNRLLATGFFDSFRLFEQQPGTYSWWDYRQQGFARNHGLRIDLLLVSQALKSFVKAAAVDPSPRAHDQPSDHAPVSITLEV